MRRCAQLLCVAGLFSCAGAVWPRPQSLHSGTQVVRLVESLDVRLDACAGLELVQQDLAPAIARTLAHLELDGLQRLVVDRGESDRSAVLVAPTLSRLVLSLNSSSYASLADELNKSPDDIDESYVLDVPHCNDSDSSLTAALTANTSLGLIRGLETFTQLVYTLPSTSGPGDGARYIRQAPLHLVDRPSFPHRHAHTLFCAYPPLTTHVPSAFMLDTSRNYYPVKDILRTLDTTASVKLNVFHWHIVDQQSWPLVSPTFPDLAGLGAYSRDEVYGLDDVKRVVDYAAGLGISVMLELDMPGHTASIAAAFPDYIACLDARPWSLYAAEPPAGQLKLGNHDVLAFAQRILRDAAALSASRLISTGGDEVNERCYLEDPDTATAMTAQNATLDELLSVFVSGTHASLREMGKTPVVWEEMVLKHNLGLKKDTVVTVWINSSNVRAVAEQGYRIIHAASDYFYLDCGAGAWLGQAVNASSWCDPFKSWQKSYSFDPYANLNPEQHHLVLGGEALVWSEQAGPENLDSIAWPRAAAAAEIFWTGGAVGPGERSLDEALPRLHDWRYRAVRRGVEAIPLQPHWCALRPGSCDAEQE